MSEQAINLLERIASTRFPYTTWANVEIEQIAMLLRAKLIEASLPPPGQEEGQALPGVVTGITSVGYRALAVKAFMRRHGKNPPAD
jgi:hypothetical protein